MSNKQAETRSAGSGPYPDLLPHKPTVGDVGDLIVDCFYTHGANRLDFTPPWTRYDSRIEFKHAHRGELTVLLNGNAFRVLIEEAPV